MLPVVFLFALTAAQWHVDIDVFARELPKRHLNAFHHMTREQFDAAVDDLRKRAITANDDEMYVGLLRVTAMVGDAHTFVGGFPNRRRIPIAIAAFGDDFRVVRATEASKSLLGGRVVRIGDAAITDVAKAIRTILSQDETEEYVRSLVPGWLTSADVLHGLHIIDDPGHPKVTVESEGTEQTVTLDSVPVTTDLPLKAAEGPPPLFRQDPDDGFVVRWLESARTAYVNFRNYKDLGSKARDLWKLVDSKPVETIVIDLRQNGGGDYKAGHRYLVSEVVSRPRLKPYVLISSRTFSAGMNNAVQFRDEAHATLVGQPIGERPNSYQERRSFRLPNSGLEVTVSTQFYKFVSDDAPNQVVPSKRIDTTWEDYLAGRDPVMDWVLSQK